MQQGARSRVPEDLADLSRSYVNSGNLVFQAACKNVFNRGTESGILTRARITIVAVEVIDEPLTIKEKLRAKLEWNLGQWGSDLKTDVTQPRIRNRLVDHDIKAVVSATILFQ